MPYKHYVRAMAVLGGGGGWREKMRNTVFDWWTWELTETAYCILLLF